MKLKPVVPGLYELTLGQVNAHLLETGDSLILVDTGYPGSAPAICSALGALGRSPGDISHIVLTHCHEDHAGSLAELKRLTGATTYMHSLDAELTRKGVSLRPLVAGPGLLNGLVYRMIMRQARTAIEPAEVEHEVANGETLARTGGLRAIHVPGHCAGQFAWHWPHHGGVLFAADSCANFLGLAMSPAYEDLAHGRQSLARLAREEFAVAVFGHGKPIKSGASRRFRAKCSHL